jgi:beta-1,4-mannosyl-glycoprotein beta-1,4-N-acetylglucosaminyltransferase
MNQKYFAGFVILLAPFVLTTVLLYYSIDSMCKRREDITFRELERSIHLKIERLKEDMAQSSLRIIYKNTFSCGLDERDLIRLSPQEKMQLSQNLSEILRCPFDAFEDFDSYFSKKAQKENWENRKEPVIIADTFLFSNEDQLLSIRINELGEDVDYFLIGQCDKDFKGKEKSITLQGERWDKLIASTPYAQKVILQHCQLDNFPTEDGTDEETNFLREGLIRSDLIRGLNQIKEKHPNQKIIVILSDVDEIPNAGVVRGVRKWNVSILYLYQLFYKYHFSCNQGFLWLGPVVFDLELVQNRTLEQIRQDSFDLRSKDPSTMSNGIACAGWHCSSCLPPEELREKLRTFAHVLEIPSADEVENLYRKCIGLNSKCYRERSWRNLPAILIKQWTEYYNLLPR